MKKSSIILVLIIMTTLLLVSCTPKVPVETNNPGITQSPTEQPSETTPAPTNTSEPSNTNPPPSNSSVPEEPEVDPQEERDLLEAERALRDGEFYVPLKPLDAEGERKNGDSVRAIYVTDHIFTTNQGEAGRADWRIMRYDKDNIELYRQYVEALLNRDSAKSSELSYLNSSLTNLEKIIGTILGTEMNAIVLNLKSGDGGVTLPVSAECFDIVGSKTGRFKEIEGLMEAFKQYDIYTIARVTSFQDDTLAKYNNYEHAIKNPDGSIWLDDNGSAWVDPNDKWVQQYNIAAAKEVALFGFDEVNFDYVRFPEGNKWGRYYQEYMKVYAGERSDKIIEGYLKDAYEALKPYNVNVSADIFGLVSRQWDSDDCFKIGQNWYRVAPYVDYICPMIYPSHYTTGWYGFEKPDMNPYGMVRGAMIDSIEKNAAFDNKAKVRLWVQDFTASYLYKSDSIFYYNYEQMYDQIRALRELNSFTYSFWNNGLSYAPERYIFPLDKSGYPNYAQDHDPIGRTPDLVVKDFLSALASKAEHNIYKLFVLVPIETRSESYDDWMENEYLEYMNIKILGYTIGNYTITDTERTEADVEVILRYTIEGSDEITVTTTWKTIMENDIWKVFPEF